MGTDTFCGLPMKFSTFAHMSQDQDLTPKPYEFWFCLSTIWPINRCVITAFGFVSFRTVYFFLLSLINLLQIWALFRPCLWKDSQGLSALRPNDCYLICLRQLFGRRWIDTDFDASIVPSQICLPCGLWNCIWCLSEGSGKPHWEGESQRGRICTFLQKSQAVAKHNRKFEWFSSSPLLFD